MYTLPSGLWNQGRNLGVMRGPTDSEFLEDFTLLPRLGDY
jgi:hypothetical protein